MSVVSPKFPRRRPTIADVARICGLSKATVSKAMNLSETECPLLPETRQRVLEAAASVGYRASWRGRILAGRKTYIIGVLYDGRPYRGTIPRGVYWNIVDHLDQLLEAQGYSTTFVRLADTEERCDQILGDQRFDGCLSLGNLPPEALRALRRNHMPTVLINTHASDEWTQVSVDDEGGTFAAMKHLYDLGHRRITYYPGRRPNPFPAATIRSESYLRFMREAGLEPDELFTGPIDQFVDRVLTGSYRPTAILDFEHWTAVRAMQEFWRRGVRVPDEISYVTFNDTYPVDAVIPPLTTVALPSELIAEKAVELLMAQMNQGERLPPRRLVLDEYLVIRESTAAPRQNTSAPIGGAVSRSENTSTSSKEDH